MELEKIFTDQQTGKNFNRPRYQILKEDVLRPGDELIITEVDRLGRNKSETLKELQYYRDNNIRVKILELPTTLMDISKLDNSMAQMLMETVNNMLIELYAAMAQAEIEKKEKRQREGIDAKKANVIFDEGSYRNLNDSLVRAIQIYQGIPKGVSSYLQDLYVGYNFYGRRIIVKSGTKPYCDSWSQAKDINNGSYGDEV